MTEGPDLHSGTDGGICKHKIQFICRETDYQPLGLAFMTGQVHRSARFQGRLDETECDEFWQGVRDPDQQSRWTVDGTAFYDICQLPAQAEDFISVTGNHHAEFRELEAAPGACKQFLPERVLQRAELAADGWLGQPKLLTCLGNTSFLAHHPE